MLSGTEADILNSVARSGQATKQQISREVGFSLDYIGFLCQSLVRKGYLTFSNGCYSLSSKSKADIETLSREGQEIDKRLIKEIACKLAKEIRNELKREAEKQAKGQIKIKTDFEFPVEDRSLALESNINKIGAKVEKEKSDIVRSIQLIKKIQKERRRYD